MITWPPYGTHCPRCHAARHYTQCDFSLSRIKWAFALQTNRYGGNIARLRRLISHDAVSPLLLGTIKITIRPGDRRFERLAVFENGYAKAYR